MYGLVGVLQMTDSVVSVIVTNRKKSTQEFCVGSICVEETIVKTLEFYRKCWRDHGWIKVYPMSRTTWTFYLELREAT